VHMLGTRSDVPDILGAADVLLLASKSEGMPAVAIEAGIAATPVAAYALSGVPEVVVDGATGTLACPGDSHELAASVIRLLDDKDLRDRMSSAARDRCTTQFDIKHVAVRYFDLYRRLLGATSLIGVH
jgi:glycosyltransferase involved in cell wall biosynthesis